MVLKNTKDTPIKEINIQFSWLNANWYLQVRPFYWIFMLLVIALGIRLGVWQLDRADQKEQALKLEQNRQVQLISGKFLASPIILLDNQHAHGKVGYEVIQFFSPSGSGQKILVNRGWVPAHSQRSVIPPLERPSDVKVSLPLKQHTLSTRSPSHNTEWLTKDILRVQAINPELLSTLNQPRLDYLRLQSHNTALTTNHWINNQMAPEKHMGYAVQWFLLTAVAAIILLISSIHRKKADQHSTINKKLAT
ncbi:SURF1 family protein [Litoribacillus peritrichatus]|uniref:SURF1-like protein n=1 Tax=Litoribacillus peritrichatus TaxID=718191 RepID=A0ABP7M1I6_9GAMM